MLIPHTSHTCIQLRIFFGVKIFMTRFKNYISDSTTHYLMAGILMKQHIPDKRLDKKIDFNAQYIRLKLLPTDRLGAMHLNKCERPDQYQQELDSAADFQDEDLIKGEDFQKYILIRGRAGIGKTTLVQRLLWKWANVEWATQYKAMFLLNMRFLMTQGREVNLSRMLSIYHVYNTGKADTIDAEWLQNNEGNIGLILGEYRTEFRVASIYYITT